MKRPLSIPGGECFIFLESGEMPNGIFNQMAGDGPVARRHMGMQAVLDTGKHNLLYIILVFVV